MPGVLALSCLALVAAMAESVLQPVDIRALLATAPVTQDADDPAIWVYPDDPSRSLILGTDKSEAPQGALFVFDLEGRIVQSIRGIDRPNNVDVEYGLSLNGKPADIAVLTERYRQRLRVFQIPSGGAGGLTEISSGGGIPVFEGQEGEKGAPMGIALYRRPRDGAVFAIVGPKEGPRERYLWQYRLEDDGKGRVKGTKVREFGRFSGVGEIEAIAVDDALSYVYYSDEGDGIHKWHADPDHPEARRELAHFGRQGFSDDREGIGIYALPDGTGYIVCTDQISGNSQYRIYRREGEAGNPHDHSRLVKVVRGGADSTDGIEVTSADLGPDFPSGLLVAMNSIGRNFLVFPWEEVALRGEPRLQLSNGAGELPPLPATGDSAASGLFPADLVNELPPELHDLGSRILSEQDAGMREDLVEELAKSDRAGSLDFLLSLLELDPSADVREEIISELENFHHPRFRQALRMIAATDQDLEIALEALEILRLQQTDDLIRLLERRLHMARRGGRQGEAEMLAREHERWMLLKKGAMLPGFLREVPPLFSVKPENQSIRVLAFGDYGDGSPEQKQVAATMASYHRLHPFDFAITLGDNFYSEGMYSPEDPRWETWWSQLYDPLGIQFYASLGNHDWGHPDSPAAEILYSRKSPSWRMPAPYYTFTAGPVQFFALDTDEISEAQRIWLREELDRSGSAWKVVYAHHPIYSAGRHEENERLISDLLPILRNRADVYLAGHDHDLQHLQAEAGVHFFVAGGGGASIRPTNPDPRTLFAKSSFGFAVLEADAGQLTVKFVDTNLDQLYEFTLNR